MKRERNFDGAWGYCSKCGHKAYEPAMKSDIGTYSLCAYQCGHISTFRGISYQAKNTITLERAEGDVIRIYPETNNFGDQGRIV